ncbi:MAG: YraN family protein [Alphaproteobacteria bacterium]|nr:YraN family protein [Alphaproteobacteria bacterium]
MRKVSDRRAAERRGRRAEALAELHLRLTGWRILDARARTGVGEIDLVACKGAVLAFIEVKQRADLKGAREALSPRQRQRLIRAGAVWRGRHDRFADHEIRFDLMIVAPWRWPRRITSAFTAEGRDGRDLI